MRWPRDSTRHRWHQAKHIRHHARNRWHQAKHVWHQGSRIRTGQPRIAPSCPIAAVHPPLHRMLHMLPEPPAPLLSPLSLLALPSHLAASPTDGSASRDDPYPSPPSPLPRDVSPRLPKRSGRRMAIAISLASPPPPRGRLTNRLPNEESRKVKGGYRVVVKRGGLQGDGTTETPAEAGSVNLSSQPKLTGCYLHHVPEYSENWR